MENPSEQRQSVENAIVPPWRLTLATVVIFISGFNVGTIFAFTSPAIVKMDIEPNPFHLTLEQQSWTVSTAFLGGFVGGLFQRPFADGFGRKLSLLVTLTPLSIGWVIVLAAQDHWMLYVGRFLTGLAGGLSLGCAPIYVAEISPNVHRGFLLSFFTFQLSFGIVWTYIIGEFFSWQWLIVSYLGFIVVMVTGLIFVPESPRWLALIGDKEGAIASLKWFAGHDNVLKEFNEIEANVMETSRLTFQLKEMINRRFYLPLVMTLGLTTIQIWTGIGVFDSYTVTIFQLAKSSFNPFLATTIVGLVEFSTNFMILILISRVSRRFLLLISGIGMTISLASLAAFYKILSGNPEFANDRLYWLPITSMILYFVTYGMGWNALPTIMTGELLPLRMRGLASGLTSAWSFISIYLTTLLFPIIVQNAGQFSPFLLYACIAAFGLLFTIFILPETKGKTLEEIEESFRHENHNKVTKL